MFINLIYIYIRREMIFCLRFKFASHISSGDQKEKSSYVAHKLAPWDLYVASTNKYLFATWKNHVAVYSFYVNSTSKHRVFPCNPVTTTWIFHVVATNTGFFRIVVFLYCFCRLWHVFFMSQIVAKIFILQPQGFSL